MTTTAPSSAAVVAPPIPPLRPAAVAVAAPCGDKAGSSCDETSSRNGKASATNALVDQKTALAAQEARTDRDQTQLTKEEEQQLREMKRRDTEVRRHEQAHARTGGQHAGAPHFEYEQGPDGRRYAVSGSVPIDVSPVSGDPQATIRKMDVVKRAALAPGDPSAQDRSVAARAQQEKLKAQRELSESSGDDETGIGRLSGNQSGFAAPDTNEDKSTPSAGYAQANTSQPVPLVSLIA